MKKNINFIIILLSSILLVSCNQDAIKPTIDPSLLGKVDAAFTSKVLVHTLSTADNGAISIEMFRGNTKSEAVVPMVLTDASGKFSLSAPNVTFAAGSNNVICKIRYNISALTLGGTYRMTLAIKDSTDMSISYAGLLSITAKLPK